MEASPAPSDPLCISVSQRAVSADLRRCIDSCQFRAQFMPPSFRQIRLKRANGGEQKEAASTQLALLSLSLSQHISEPAVPAQRTSLIRSEVYLCNTAFAERSSRTQKRPVDHAATRHTRNDWPCSLPSSQTSLMPHRATVRTVWGCDWCQTGFRYSPGDAVLSHLVFRGMEMS